MVLESFRWFWRVLGLSGEFALILETGPPVSARTIFPPPLALPLNSLHYFPFASSAAGMVRATRNPFAKFPTPGR